MPSAATTSATPSPWASRPRRALTLFPLVAKLFTTALTPVSEAATNFTKKRFHDREFTIGLDWPVMAGRSEHWLVMILTIPVLLVYALILPGNIVLPFGGLMNICLVVPLFYHDGQLREDAHRHDHRHPDAAVRRVVLRAVLHRPRRVQWWRQHPDGQQLAWFGMDISELRYIAAEAVQLTPVGIVLALVTVALTVYYFRGIKKDDLAIQAELEGRERVAV